MPEKRGSMMLTMSAATLAVVVIVWVCSRVWAISVFVPLDPDVVLMINTDADYFLVCAMAEAHLGAALGFYVDVESASPATYAGLATSGFTAKHKTFAIHYGLIAGLLVLELIVVLIWRSFRSAAPSDA